MAVKSSYATADLHNAVEEIRAGVGLSVRATARKYGIPSSTLHDHLSGKYHKQGAGGPTVLAEAVEREIALSCTTLADMGFGLSRDVVEVVVFEYLRDNEIPNPFTGGVPGNDWWRRFMSRWPSLTERKPQHLTKARSRAGCKEVIDAWFDRVKEVLTTAGLDPTDPKIAVRLWNCDETGFCTSSSATKLIVKRGAKQVHEVGGGSGHEYITVQCCGSASGERLPPFILYKGKNMYRRWMEGGPAGALYGVTDSGWMDASNFLSWFNKLLVPAVSHLTATAPVVLFFDGHHSHISLELIREARDKNIVILCLPPNTTHLLQPLDVGVFAPLKSTWRKVLKSYKLSTRGQKVSKETFPSLIAELWEVSFTPAHCKGGFRGAGLFPFSREHILGKLPPTASPEPHPDTSEEEEEPAITRIACTHCGHKLPTTPVVKTHIVSYFAGILEVKESAPKIGQRNNLRIRVEGEAITSDEFMEMLEAHKIAKEKEKKEKGKKAKKQQKETENKGKDGKLMLYIK